MIIVKVAIQYKKIIIINKYLQIVIDTSFSIIYF